MKFEKIKVGMKLYDRHSERMGNSALRTIGEWEVRIISIDIGSRTAEVSWNGNPAQAWDAFQLEKLKDWSMRDPDVVVERGMWDRVVRVRKMTKAEKAAKVSP